MPELVKNGSPVIVGGRVLIRQPTEVERWLAWRLVVASVDADGTPRTFPSEADSNGCVGCLCFLEKDIRKKHPSTDSSSDGFLTIITTVEEPISNCL